MEQTSLITMTAEDLRNIIREEVDAAVQHLKPQEELPHFLTREEAKKLLRISETKMCELMGRTDFPVCREFGVKIYTGNLLKWVEDNTQGIQPKTTRIRSVI